VTTPAQGNFIDGEWRSGAGGAVDLVVDPATGDVIAEVASSTAADVDAAVDAAARAFPAWRGSPHGDVALPA
jgi:succinate-semialdehyde dehydrogenase/glutarate-semialdehyde dehydrogenase